jgi:hypothetical protein
MSNLILGFRSLCFMFDLTTVLIASVVTLLLDFFQYFKPLICAYKEPLGVQFPCSAYRWQLALMDGCACVVYFVYGVVV